MPISLYTLMKRERVRVARRLETQRRAARYLEKLLKANHKYGSRPWWPTVEARGRVTVGEPASLRPSKPNPANGPS